MRIELDEVKLAFGERVVLEGVSINVPEGKVSVIMGPSGSGKTVLLRLMGGQLSPVTGYVRVDGHDLAQLSRSELQALRMKMGVLFQTSALFPDLTVFENVAYPLREHTDLPSSLLRDIVLMKLHAVGLRGARDLFPAQLSGGMQRRVAIARAVVFDPQAIFYDDPFSGLDPISIATIMRLIKTLNRTLGITTVIVSHDVDEILAIADYINLISGGRVVESGSVNQLAASKNPLVRQFMTGNPEGPASFHLPGKNMAAEIFS